MLAFGLMQPGGSWSAAIAQVSAPIFSKSSLEDGIAQAKGDRVLVVYVSGIIDGRNEAVEAQWRDPRVEAWVRSHGWAMVQVADNIRVPVRALSAFAGENIAFRNGVEFDRDAAFSTTEELLEWLDMVGRGSVPLEYAAKRTTVPGAAGTALSQGLAAQVHALRLERATHPDEAVREYIRALRVFIEMGDGWRCGWVASRLKPLLPALPGAIQEIARLRDELEPKLTPPALESWLQIYALAPDPDRLIAWYKRVAQTPEWSGVLARTNSWFLLMIQSEHWEQVGTAIENPVSLARAWEARPRLLRGMSDAPRPTGQGAAVITQEEVEFAAKSALLYAALLAAKREQDAETVASQLLALVDSPDSRGVLVEMALKAGQVRPSHVAWAEAADKARPDVAPLVPRVKLALQAPK